MRRFLKVNGAGCLLVVLVWGLGFWGCAPKALRQPAGPMDTPQHHVFSGMTLLDKMDLDEAIREFNLALELDSTYSPGQEGLGLALGYKNDFDAAYDAMSKAKKYSKTKEEEAMAYVGFMRLHTLEKKKGWIDDVENYFHKAVGRVEAMPEAYYYMGIAYKEDYRFNEAEKDFKQVLAINKNLVGQADEQMKLVQKIQRAMPGTEVGKKLTLQEKITRADCAAIFVHELRLEKVFENAGRPKGQQRPLPEDVKNHPLRTDVETIVGIGLRGLEVFPDGDFRPDDPVTRGVYAMMMEDIICAVTHDNGLSTKYIGTPSPFPDVSSDLPYFNAVMVCTTRGIMEAEDIRTGQFNPKGDVGGADALLIIRRLKETLKIF
jgi:hypothetical protein